MIGIASFFSRLLKACGCAALAAASAAYGQASGDLPAAEPRETYADLADLTDSSDLVVHVKVKRQAELGPDRAPGLPPGIARLYIEAETLSLLAGRAAVGEAQRYLVDVARDERGRVPKLKKREFILFARSVQGSAGELQLIDSQAQLEWSAGLETRLRPILAQLYAADAMPQVVGIRDALSVAGNLAGESETQVFLRTGNNEPLALSIIRRPGMAPVWGYSRSEIVDQSARVPQAETIEWYRLACFLPRSLPPEANLAQDARSQQQAIADYAYVVRQLGPCPRRRG